MNIENSCDQINVELSEFADATPVHTNYPYDRNRQEDHQYLISFIKARVDEVQRIADNQLREFKAKEAKRNWDQFLDAINRE